MSILFELLGAAGTGKSTCLIERMRGLVAEDHPVLLVLPDQISFDYDKRLYQVLGAELYNRVEVYSFSRLCSEIFKKLGRKSGQYLDEYGRKLFMFQALQRLSSGGELSYYDKQAKSPRFVPAAVEINKELIWSAIKPGVLLEKSLNLGDSNTSAASKVRDIALISAEYERQINEAGKVDSLNDIAIAAQKAAAALYFSEMYIFVDQFQSFSLDELQLLEVMLGQCAEFHIALCTGNEKAKESTLFGFVNHTRNILLRIASENGVSVRTERLSQAYTASTSGESNAAVLHHLSGNIFQPQKSAFKEGGNGIPTPFPIKLMEATDLYEEAEWVAAEISRLTREEGFKRREIAVVTRQLDEYHLLLQAALERFGITFFLDGEQPVRHHALIIMLEALLELASRSSVSTEVLFRYAKTGVTGLSLEDLSLLENWCYKWNVEGDMWHQAVPEIDRDYNSAIIEGLKSVLLEPVLRFREAVKGAVRAGEYCRLVWDFMEQAYKETLTETSDDPIRITAARERRQIWDIIVTILDAVFDSLGEQALEFETFRQIVSLLLSDAATALPPQTLDAVLVAGTERVSLATSAPKIVFILGVNDGYFPKAVKPGGLLTDRDKTALEALGLTFSVNSRQKLGEERFSAYSALAAPSHRIYISWSLRDLSGRARFASFVVNQIAAVFPGLERGQIKDIPTIFFCSTQRSAYYKYVSSYKKKDSVFLGLKRLLLEDTAYRPLIEELDRTAANQFTDEVIEQRDTARAIFPPKMYISASRLEDYLYCPFMYFCKKGLKLRLLKPVKLDSAQQGNALHFALATVMGEYDKERLISISEETLAESISSALKTFYDNNLGGNFNPSKRFQNLYKQLEYLALQTVLHIREELEQSAFSPEGFEIKIGGEGASVEPMRIVAENGTEIFFIGTIDRLDTCEINGMTYVRVVDYKSGNKHFRLEDLFYGLNLQMLLYLFTVTQEEYEVLPAGVLYMPIGAIEPGLPRKAGEAEIIKYKDKSFKMNGLILEEPEAIEAMEKGVAGIYIPVKTAKEGFTKASSLISQKHFQRLRHHAFSILKQMAQNLSEGKIEAKPLKKGENLPCSYCDYWSVCGKTPHPSPRSFDKNAKELLMDILETT